ncbi:outer membrane beta-barrel family protein [Hymenobacter arizonensis]|uniref:outer membrane beta-barrel family protein n=1 Tax=Hymenobacter arizonensis TaxID=1227077 RepID=UPI0015A7261A|nr:outer membrane beta-barrel family protein [Hymenobacter arizonensis]
MLLAPQSIWAQQHASVTGAVAKSTGGPIELATVTLHLATDSSVVKTEFSDAQGTFRLDAAGSGTYLVSVAQVGFNRYWSPKFELPPTGLTLPGIQLVPSQATTLKDVVVTARKPLFEHKGDRIVINVADSPLSSGATALDVLGRAPAVTMDVSENISLRGRQGLLVVIDGKRTPLTGRELADFLRALPAEQLQSVELITNPPAQYDAQGGAGIIAINLKKDQRHGTNGSVNMGYGRGVYGKFTSGLALNHRSKKTNVYGNYAYADRRGFVLQDFARQYSATSQLPLASSVIANEQRSHLRSHSAKAGLDLTLTERTLLGVSGTVLHSFTEANTDNKTLFYNEVREVSGRYSSRVEQDINRPNGTLNLNFRHSFADSANAKFITADADFGRYDITRQQELRTVFEVPAFPNSTLTGDQQSSLVIQALKADFSQPLPQRARLDMGLKVTRIVSDNNVEFTRLVNGTSMRDGAISGPFWYEENVNAAYISMRGVRAKTALQAGLRAEQTNTRADVEGAVPFRRNYMQLFPSASLQRALNERHALGATVARRIDRPSYAQVNPLRSYFDITSYRSGNPNLVAQTSYNVELTHTYRQKFITSLAYAQTDQPIVNVVQPSPDGGRLVVNRDVNLSTQHYYALSLTAPLEPTKWWTLYSNAVFYYSRFQGELAETKLDRSRPAFLFSANNNFSLPRGWSAELNGNFQSREIWGFEDARARGQVGASLQKSLWNKQGSFRLNVTDIFYTNIIGSTSDYANFSETSRFAQDSRVVTAALTYRFGNSKVAATRKRTVGADDELRRAGGQ